MVCHCHRPYRQKLVRELIKARQLAESNRKRFRCPLSESRYLHVENLVQRFCR